MSNTILDNDLIKKFKLVKKLNDTTYINSKGETIDSEKLHILLSKVPRSKS